MDYKEIEFLVKEAKNNNENAKEKLVSEFKPIILSIVRKVYVDSFEYEDLVHECYITLFKCISLYDLTQSRFVGYTVRAIKNNLNYLIEKSVRRKGSDGPQTLTLDDKLETFIEGQEDIYNRKISDIIDKELIKVIFNNLSKDELELIDFIVLNENTVRKYASLKKLNYSTAVLRKKTALNKIRLPFMEYYNSTYSI